MILVFFSESILHLMGSMDQKIKRSKDPRTTPWGSLSIDPVIKKHNMVNSNKKRPRYESKHWGAILFLDIVKSSTKWKMFPHEMMNKLEEFDSRIRDHLVHPEKQIIKTIGDAYMILFEGNQAVNSALTFAIDVQTSLVTNPILFSDEATMIMCRMGIGYGEMSSRTLQIQSCYVRDVFGNTVNMASRMESKVCAHGGDIALGMLEQDDGEEKLSEIWKTVIPNHIRGRVEMIQYSDTCMIYSQDRRSQRLMITTKCHNVETLHGVGNAVALLIHLVE